MEAASKLGQHLTDVSGPPSMIVDSLFHGLMGTKGLSQDEAARVIATTAAASKGMSTSEYINWTLQAAEAALNEPWSLFPPGYPTVGGQS